MPVYPTPGPAPKPASKRRRRNTPRSYGAAKPTTAPAAHVQDRVLGFDAHPLVVEMWVTIRESAESKFYSHADWEPLGVVVCEHSDAQPPAIRSVLGADSARFERSADQPGGQAQGCYRAEAAWPGHRRNHGGVDDERVQGQTETGLSDLSSSK
jgi:hypothetical protein